MKREYFAKYYVDSIQTLIKLDNLGDYIKLVVNQDLKNGYIDKSKQKYDQAVEDKYFKHTNFNRSVINNHYRPSLHGLVVIKDEMFICDTTVAYEFTEEMESNQYTDIKEAIEDLKYYDRYCGGDYAFYNRGTTDVLFDRAIQRSEE